MDMREFIKQNCDTLEHQIIANDMAHLDYSVIEDCINNDAELYEWAQAAGVDV